MEFEAEHLAHRGGGFFVADLGEDFLEEALRERVGLLKGLPESAIAQVLRVGYGPFGIATPLVTLAILMTLAMRVGQASVAFTASQISTASCSTRPGSG